MLDTPATTKDALEALDAKFEAHFGALHARFTSLEVVVAQMFLTLADMPNQFARQATAITEDFRRQIAIVDEKYSDLPERVAALEQAK